MKKILLVTPHLSTGGLPQFLLKKINVLKNEFDLYLIEWDNFTGGRLVVQRNQICDILGKKLFTLGEEKKEILDIIKKISPSIIHFEEFPETFISHEILEKIFSNKNFHITETTHGTLFDKKDKKYIADKTMFVSDVNYTQYNSITNNSEVIKFDVNPKEDRTKILKDLNLDPEYFHVMNVGLFNRNKNQGEIFDYARKLENEKIQFHFFGNMAGNFEDYWKPLVDNKPKNCKIWDERNDVYKFYPAMDLFLFTSKLENRPLSVIEALSYDMKILMYNLSSYGGEFSKFENVNYLTSDFNYNSSLIKRILGIGERNINLKMENLKIKEILIGDDIREKKRIEIISKKDENQIQDAVIIEEINSVFPYDIHAFHMLTDIDTDREIKSMISLSKLRNYGIKYKTCINRRYTDLPPAETCQYPEKISMEPGGKLTPGHYGCYLAHKGAFFEGVESGNDFIFIFECDCVIDTDYKTFLNHLKFACETLNNTHDLLMFSFGFHNNTNIIDKRDGYWVVDRFYGAHAYLIPKRSFDIIKNMYETSKWNVSDLLFCENLNMYKTGIFETPITKQSAGLSILDKIYNHDRH